MSEYTEEHEWLRVDGDEVIVGITDFAQEQLGEVVFVELPEAGTTVDQGDDIVVDRESGKAASYRRLLGDVDHRGQRRWPTHRSGQQIRWKSAAWFSGSDLPTWTNTWTKPLMDAAAYKAHPAFEETT